MARRIAGLTAEELMNTLYTQADGTRVPDHERFLWRASAFLREHPEACAELESAFTDAAASHERRGLVLDLLVSARHDTAQASLTRLLATDEAASDPDFAYLFQRLSFLRSPTPETVDFVVAALETATGDHETAAAYSAGSVAGHLARRGDEPSATRLGLLLAKRVEDEPTAEGKAHGLRALANLKTDQFHDVFARFSRNPDPALRVAVADGLGETRTSAARTTLLELAADPDRDVRAAALRSLDEDPLPVDAMTELARLAALPDAESVATDFLRIASLNAGRAPEQARAIAAALVGRGSTAAAVEAGGLLAVLDAAASTGLPLPNLAP
jgi:hypothetical protein